MNRPSAVSLVLFLSLNVTLGAEYIREQAIPMAPGSIAGTVVDSATARPLCHAEIVVINTGEKVVPQADGSFEITGLPAGHYRLKVGALDHWPGYFNVDVESGVRRDLRVALPRYSSELLEILGAATVKVALDLERFTAAVGFMRGADGKVRIHIQRDDASQWLIVAQSAVSAELLERIRMLKDGDSISLNTENDVVNSVVVNR